MSRLPISYLGSHVLPLPGRMWRPAIVRSALVLGLAWLVSACLAGLDTGHRLAAAMNPHPDGAGSNTMWVSSYVDVPGLQVADLHCKGTLRLSVQIGEVRPLEACGGTRPRALPPGVVRSVGVECGIYLPNGMVIRRISVNGGPWRYELARNCLSGIRSMGGLNR